RYLQGIYRHPPPPPFRSIRIVREGYHANVANLVSLQTCDAAAGTSPQVLVGKFGLARRGGSRPRTASLSPQSGVRVTNGRSRSRQRYALVRPKLPYPRPFSG